MNECAREIAWAGGKHVFNLNDKSALLRMQVMGLRGHNGNTPAACLSRFENSAYSIDDVERIIEWGLIGGGTKPSDARTLVAEHVREKPLAANAVIAFEVLAALFIGAANANA